LIKFGKYYYEAAGYIGVTVQIHIFQGKKTSILEVAVAKLSRSWGEEQHFEFVVLPHPKIDAPMLDST